MQNGSRLRREGRSPERRWRLPAARSQRQSHLPERRNFYGEKEFLIRQFKLNGRIKLSDFCTLNKVSDAAFRKWLRQYEEGGLEGLARADAEIREVLPEGIDRTEEAYKREILRLRIENERLKKSYAVQMNEAGEQEYVRLREKSSK